MPTPNQEDLVHVVGAHFQSEAGSSAAGSSAAGLSKEGLEQEIREFVGEEGNLDRATDQLLNALYLLTLRQGAPASDEQRSTLRKILYRQLHD
jgi:hypothetical protein